MRSPPENGSVPAQHRDADQGPPTRAAAYQGAFADRRPTVALRGYQLDAIKAIEARYQAGIRRQLLVLPTGTGKTVVFAEVVRRRRRRAVILVHRDELVRQADDKLRAIGLRVGIVKAEQDETGADVIVASVQTLARPQRLARLVSSAAGPAAHPQGPRDAVGDLLSGASPRSSTASALRRGSPASSTASEPPEELVFSAPRRGPRPQGLGPFRTVVVDEAHHAAAASYRTVLDHLVGDDTLLLGVTATPGRGDGAGLDDVFDEIVYQKTLPEMVCAGYLSDLRAVRIDVPVDLDKVAVSAGDYTAAGLGEALEEAHLPAIAARAYCDHAPGRRALMFTPTVALAHQSAQALRDAGVPAEALDGTTPLDERRSILGRFDRGETEVLANCGVLTEGFDCPAIDCVIVGRPTRSQLLYLQMIGRGTRRHPGKSDLLIVDLVGSTTRHGLVTLAGLSGLDDEVLERGVARALTEGKRPAMPAKGGTWAGDLAAHEIDLFRRRPMAWVAAGSRWLLGYGPGSVVLEPAGGGWQVVDRPRDAAPTLVAGDLSLLWAQGVGEDVVRSKGTGATILARSDAPWRKRPASDKQLDCLRRMRIGVDPDELTAGEASDIISARMARSA